MTFWNPERVNVIIHLWDQGLLSAGQIGDELHCTRNSVIGKAHRLKLSARRKAPPPRQRAHARADGSRSPFIIKPPKAISVPPEPILPPQPVEGGVSIIDLEQHHCRAIVGAGDDGLARYCGAHKEGLIATRTGRMFSSYCQDHGSRYYNR